MRINIGIRRRLAPLLDNNRRRIELLNSILFSFPGTPILYYGDEIGMGDNIYLGDRNGVRTPMQWTPDRNAGFSRANPAKLYSPVIMDPVWGYEAINVEAQQNDPSSLLNWMRNMIALRKLFQVFGRGSLRFLDPSNRKILAYIRQYQDETVLCVANLSRFAQPVQLDLSGMEGMTPVEMLGYVEFPANHQGPVLADARALRFPVARDSADRWPAAEAARQPTASRPSTSRTSATGKAFSRATACGASKHFSPRISSGSDGSAAKSRNIVRARIADSVLFDEKRSALLWVSVDYVEGESDTWLLCLAMSFGEAASRLRESAPHQILATAGSAMRSRHSARGPRCADAPDALLEILANGDELRTRSGTRRRPAERRPAQPARFAAAHLRA